MGRSVGIVGAREDRFGPGDGGLGRGVAGGELFQKAEQNGEVFGLALNGFIEARRHRQGAAVIGHVGSEPRAGNVDVAGVVVVAPFEAPVVDPANGQAASSSSVSATIER